VTVRELEDRLSATELLEWISFLAPPKEEKKIAGNLLDLDPAQMAASFTRGM
jgi:hypothetical protein